MAQQLTTKKLPERRCVGCGVVHPKKELVRIVRTPLGTIELDTTGKLSGRGAYICFDEKCLAKARKSNRIASSLNAEIPQDVYESLEARFASK